MKKIALCVDNENVYFEEMREYLDSHECKTYCLSSMQNAEEVLEKIEQEEGKLDFLILSVNGKIAQDGAIGEKHDCEKILETVGGQIVWIQNVIDAALPLLRRGEQKRIGMITAEDSSISHCRDDRDYARHMAWAGCNMIGKLYFNLLRPEGFTFRWYCAQGDHGGMRAGEYFLTKLCYDSEEPFIHSEENRFVMRNARFVEIPW